MLQAIWYILCESAIFILVGFLLAGVLHMLVPGSAVVRLLSKPRSSSVYLASLVGLPLPLCSCSVLPAAVTLRQKGASKGATLSFLISTPETSVTSVLLTYSLLGPTMAIMRPIASGISAIVAGLVENVVGRRAPAPPPPVAPDPCCSCDPVPHEPKTDVPKRKRDAAVRILRFGFIDLFDDLFGWILVGIVAAAAIQTILPEIVFHTIFRGSLQSMLVMVVLGVPLYVCAEASTPIAAVFIAQGVSPGAALVFLLVGPATNIGSLGVLDRLLGRRTVIVYLACIIVVALAMGGILNSLLAQSDVVPAVRTMEEPLVPQSAKVAGSLAFLILSVVSARRLRYAERMMAWLNARLPFRVTGRRLGVVGLIAVLAAYIGSGVFTIQPGEVGVVKRFGAVRRDDVGPGLHIAWPYPIEQVDRVPVGRVNRLVLGFKVDPETGRRTSDSDPAQSWSLVGDENIADVKSAVHWGAKPSPDEVRKFQYGVRDREDLVRSVVQGAIREVFGEESIDRLFTSRRRMIEPRIEAISRERLDAYDSGIQLYSFHFLDTHAPPDVHDSFRDVAGAMEDKATRINEAMGAEEKIVPQARGEAAQRIEEATGYAAKVIASARGEADRFLDLWREYAASPAITRKRLYFETLDAVLPGARKYLKPPARTGSDVELWFLGPGSNQEVTGLLRRMEK